MTPFLRPQNICYHDSHMLTVHISFHLQHLLMKNNMLNVDLHNKIMFSHNNTPHEIGYVDTTT